MFLWDFFLSLGSYYEWSKGGNGLGRDWDRDGKHLFGFLFTLLKSRYNLLPQATQISKLGFEVYFCCHHGCRKVIQGRGTLLLRAL